MGDDIFVCVLQIANLMVVLIKVPLRSCMVNSEYFVDECESLMRRSYLLWSCPTKCNIQISIRGSKLSEYFFCDVQLKLNGVDIDEEVTIHDPALLMEVIFFTLGVVSS